MKSVFTLMGLAALTTLSMASVKFNEFMINPISTDDGQEWVELKSSAPSESLAGLTFICIDGDATSAGLINMIQDLTPIGATGTNGLLLIRDSAVVLQPAPDPATVVFVNNWTPDIQNGTQTFLLVRGFTGSPGQDLDTDNNGTLDITPWTSVEHAIGYFDTPIPTPPTFDWNYANALGGVHFVPSGFLPNGYTFIPGGSGTHAVLAVQVPSGSLTGPYSVFSGFICDPNAVVLTPPASWTMTPGSENMAFTSIVNPSSYSIQAGLNFGGTLASLFASDNDKVAVLCDEFTPNGQVEITATGVVSASAMTAKCETSSSRTDITQFTRVRNVNTNSFDPIDIRATTLSDTAFTAAISTPANYLNAGTIVAQFFWIPTQDITAADGWVYTIDQFVYDVTP